MSRKSKKKNEVIDEQLEKIEIEDKVSRKKINLSEGFYYLIRIVIGIVLIFATREFLNKINYLFVTIFAIIAVVEVISFVMDKDYEKGNYSDLVFAVMSSWIAIFIYKYGEFIFLQLLPALISLILFIMSISSLTKYFGYKRKLNLIIGIISILLGILLIFLSGNIMDILFKITGIYILIIMILDLIDNKINTYK